MDENTDKTRQQNNPTTKLTRIKNINQKQVDYNYQEHGHDKDRTETNNYNQQDRQLHHTDR
jgi:hypothetical protein